MMKSREKKQPQLPVTRCAWCGSYDLGIGWQQNEAIVTFRRNGFLGNRLKYVICRNCGAVEVPTSGIISERPAFGVDLTDKDIHRIVTGLYNNSSKFT